MALAEDAFAKTAAEAWPCAPGAAASARRIGRSGWLRVAAAMPLHNRRNFIRCIYSHTVFPECRDRFEALLRTLRNGAEFVTSDQLADLIDAGETPDGRYYHLSFDDGWAHTANVAGPMLARLQIPFTNFVVAWFANAEPEALDDYYDRRSAFTRPVRVMNWEAVRRCIDYGGEVGCHSMTHARLSEISDDPRRLAKETVGAKLLIEQKTGASCVAFAYPYGTPRDIDEVAVASIRAAGFRINFNAVRGRVHPGVTDAFATPRHQIRFNWPRHELLLWARGYREET